RVRRIIGHGASIVPNIKILDTTLLDYRASVPQERQGIPFLERGGCHHGNQTGGSRPAIRLGDRAARAWVRCWDSPSQVQRLGSPKRPCGRGLAGGRDIDRLALEGQIHQRNHGNQVPGWGSTTTTREDRTEVR